MISISIRRLLENPEKSKLTLPELGFHSLDGTPLVKVLSSFDLGSAEDISQTTIQNAPGMKLNLSERFIELKKAGLVTDIIGPTSFRGRVDINFSTLLSQTPRTYLKAYIDIAEALTSGQDIDFCVWIEDSFSQLYRNWSTEETIQATDCYIKYFSVITPKIVLSSSSGFPGIPDVFIERYLANVTLSDFSTLLPFHLRAPELITVLDLIHFSWNCYVVSVLPGVHLVGEKTKRHFQMFRKLLGSRFSVVLVQQQT